MKFTSILAVFAFTQTSNCKILIPSLRKSLKKLFIHFGNSFCSITSFASKFFRDDQPTEDNRSLNWTRWVEIQEGQAQKIHKKILRNLLLNTNPNELQTILKENEVIDKTKKAASDISFWKLPEKLRQ